MAWNYVGTGRSQIVEANGANVVDLHRAADGVEGGDFVNGSPPASKRIPPYARFTPQIEVSMQPHQDGSNGATALKYQNES